jgi:aminopeptidase N
MIKALVLTLLLVLSFASNGYAQLKRYDVLSYTGTIELDRQDTFIRGHVKMNAVCTTGAPVDRILQHLIYLDIDSVLVNGERATIDWTGKDSGEYYVVPPASMQIPGFFTVETFYHGKPLPEQTSNKWGGVSNRGGMMFAMGVGFQAPYISCTRHWLPCYDLPDDKADSARFIFVSKDPNDIVAASGKLERTFDTLGGKAYDWHVIKPIASYLMTFAQGPFELMKIKNPLNVPFETYAFVADTAKTRRLMERRVVRGLQFFDSLFTKYPFEKVGYVVAPLGSMEHQTMITLDRRTLDTNNTTAVHELAHMWWGDLVTCHTFADPWLNEGFATYSESLYLERFEGKQAYRKRQIEKIKSAKAKGSDFPMYGAPYHTDHENNYPSAVIYDKGAAVIGMLRYELGDNSFFHALREYLKKYSYSTATSQLLREHLRPYAAFDIDLFFDQWVFGKGYPKYDIAWTPGLLTSFEIKQSEENGLFRVPIRVEATSAEGTKALGFLYSLQEPVTYTDIDFGFVPVSVQLDPDSVLIADFTVQQRSGVGQARDPQIRVSPNPVGKVLAIEIPSQFIGSRILLVDSGGRTELEVAVHDRGPVALDVSKLPSGSYRLLVQIGEEVIHSEQVVVEH